MQILAKKSQIQIEFTSDEIEALKTVLDTYETSNNTNYRTFVAELKEIIS